MDMKTSMMIILTLAILLAACGKQAEEGAAQSPPAPAQRESAAPVAAAPTPPASSAATVAPAATVEKSVSVDPVRPDVKPKVAVMGRDEALALAQQSGCLACHKIEAKLVGPAWQDVSAKYKGDADARTRMVAKVKSGGQGNWTEVTGGMPMPPYSPRVSDENIEKLVAFILSL
jgi:cytochrome c